MAHQSINTARARHGLKAATHRGFVVSGDPATSARLQAIVPVLEIFNGLGVAQAGMQNAQGFDALADLDSNADGQLTSADATWGQLQVWRDVNQDGVSQAGEINSLDALNITRIGLNGTSSGPQAGQTINNNLVALSTSYTRAGVNRTVGAIDLQANGFFSDIPPQTVGEDNTPITQAAQALPQMNGAGMVKDLRAAMSEGGTQAAQLREVVAAFAAASTRGEQLALIDTVLKDWAQTSSHWRSLEGYLAGAVNLTPPGGMSAEHYRNVVGVLEAFNGARFYSPMGSAMPAGQTGFVQPDGAWSYSISPPQMQVDLLMQAYAALREGVYQALVMQTRMKPYLDAVELVIDESGIRFDATAMHASRPWTCDQACVGDAVGNAASYGVYRSVVRLDDAGNDTEWSARASALVGVG